MNNITGGDVQTRAEGRSEGGRTAIRLTRVIRELPYYNKKLPKSTPSKAVTQTRQNFISTSLAFGTPVRYFFTIVFDITTQIPSRTYSLRGQQRQQRQWQTDNVLQQIQCPLNMPKRLGSPSKMQNANDECSHPILDAGFRRIRCSLILLKMI